MNATVSPSVYPVTVDYDQCLAAMILAGYRQYDTLHPGFTCKNFPIFGEGRVEADLVLLRFDRPVTTEKAVAAMKQKGLEPAKIEHLVAFDSQHTDVLEFRRKVVALGSECVADADSRRVPYVQLWDQGRDLDLAEAGQKWCERCRFLAVVKR